MTKSTFAVAATMAVALGCSSSTGSTGNGSGGQGAHGGGAGVGPAASGGQVGSGGLAATGGAGTGGISGSGGASPSGGAGGFGGVVGSGGSAVGGRGGVHATGGAAGMAGAAAAGGAGTAGAGGAGVPDILVPAQGALLGLYYGAGTIAATDARIGRSPQIHLTYFAWTDAWEKDARADLDAGRIPLVNWEPAGIDFADIASGKLDATIKARAQGAKNLGKKFFLDFAAEMNGDEAWSKNDAPLYVSAYRHMHDLFVAAGATNVVWVWAPNVTDTNGRNDMTLAYYPGDDYVDWTGVDGYNWGGADWQSFEAVFKNIYPLLAAKKKPIFIGEMASDEQGGDKAAWIDAMIPTLKARYPMFKALVWFDVNKEKDWRVNSTAASLAAFGRLAADPYFNP